MNPGVWISGVEDPSSLCIEILPSRGANWARSLGISENVSAQPDISALCIADQQISDFLSSWYNALKGL